jgi:tRNA pseudouridine55 synthase
MNKGKPDSRPPVHGWLILDKPQGLTSTQALGKARRLVGGTKAGHGGTLDPLATGILPLAFGEATKLIPYVMDGDKEYEFTLRWGEARDTDDAEGKVTATSPHRPSENEVQNVLPTFTGIITQTPPIYSAIKLDGERAYDLARDGQTPEMQPRQVEVKELSYLSAPDADHATFRVCCGKGMYVRALARDLAIKLGTYAHVTVLRRTRVGSFTLDKSVTLERLEALNTQGTPHDALLDLSAALAGIPFLNLAPGEAQQLRNGAGILIRPHHGDLMDVKPIFAVHQGLPVAIVEAKAGEFRVLRGFHF